jgi:hypothetical protein
VSVTDHLRAWFQGPTGRVEASLDGEATPWCVSLVVHVTLLATLAMCWMWIPTDRRVMLSALSVDPADQPAAEEFRFSVEPLDTVGALGHGGFDAARPAALVEARDSQIAYALPPTAPVGEFRALALDHTVLEGPRVTENLLVKGAGSVGTTGADGAVDRITHEILLSLDERPTLVVWLFDESGSLRAQRESIARRFDRVYDELGVIRARGNRAFERHRGQPLLSAVASFGQSVELLTRQPTDDVEEIKASVRAVGDDDSGVENVFQAVAYVAQKYRHFRLQSPGRNVMLVVFTDEAGDDVDQLDATVALCNKYEMPVYVVGVPAPFGRRQAYVKYIDPDPNFDQSVQWLPVHEGPESLLPEALQLGFTGQSQYDEPLDSGFGPFGLCRLAYETGGLYFVVHPNREVGRHLSPWETASMATYISEFFDPRLMRSYRPDYVSAEEYRKQLSQNGSLAALVEAAQLSWTAPMQNVRLRFPRQDDSQLARDLAVAQRVAARIEPKIDQLVEILRRGEPDRPQVTEPRWRAGFDLALGRALAAKVRTEGYNALLAQAKQGMRFKNERDDTWVLRPSDKVTINSALARDAADAQTYLQGVLADHAGTPWALLAERELRQPLGWEWREEFTDVAGRLRRAQERRANAANAPPRPAMPAAAPKPHRAPPAL